MKILLAIVTTFLFVGCTTKAPEPKEEIKVLKESNKYQEFKAKTNLRKSYAIYKDKELLKEANGKNSRIVIDISEQRARLFVNNKIAIDSPCTTGAKRKFEPNSKTFRDKRTPKGTFKIKEKIKDKRSTIFGKYYRSSRCVYTGDRRKCKLNKSSLRYRGASLKYWMRLTGSGIGLHESKYVKRYPGTNGCIRLPKGVASSFFKIMKVGGEVKVQN